MAKDTTAKSLAPWTIRDWNLSVRILGMDDLTSAQAARLKRHLDERLGTLPKPGPASGVTPNGFVVVSGMSDTPRAFLGVKMNDGMAAVSWQFVGEDLKEGAPAPNNFSSLLPNMHHAELQTLADAAK